MSAQMLEVYAIRSRNGAPSRKGCVLNGQMTKVNNKRVRPPSPNAVGGENGAMMPPQRGRWRQNGGMMPLTTVEATAWSPLFFLRPLTCGAPYLTQKRFLSKKVIARVDEQSHGLDRNAPSLPGGGRMMGTPPSCSLHIVCSHVLRRHVVSPAVLYRVPATKANASYILQSIAPTGTTWQRQRCLPPIHHPHPKTSGERSFGCGI